jgi:hypothetical protein
MPTRFHGISPYEIFKSQTLLTSLLLFAGLIPGLGFPPVDLLKIELL